MHLLAWGKLTMCQGHKEAQVGASSQANLRLLREKALGLAATGSLRRDLWW